MKKSIKPELERVEPVFGSSFSYRTYNKDHQNKNHTFWHYHPEIELVYVNGGSGKRQIGSHISYYRTGDLLLIGSNLPHCGFTEGLSGHDRETVIQLNPNFLGARFFDIPEMKNIKALFERAKMGIVYSGESKQVIGERIESLEEKDTFERLVGLLEFSGYWKAQEIIRY